MIVPSIGRLLIVVVFFLSINIAFSPSLAEPFIILDKDNFLEAKPLNKKFFYFTITAYSSSPDETDNTPWITAYNTITRDGIVASNDLPFGTKIRIPQIFGDKVFIVEDRLNERINGVIDVWFPTKDEALEFGIYEDVLVEILE